MSESPPKPAITPKAARKTAARPGQVAGQPAKKAAAKSAAGRPAAKKTAAPPAEETTVPAPRRATGQPTAEKTVARATGGQPADRSAISVAAATAVTVSLPVEPDEVRRSWFSRRPQSYSRADWSAGWSEHGRRLTGRRTVLVVVPLVVALAVVAAFGAHLLYADATPVSVQEPDVTCWDRTQAPASECPLPSGVDGLAWVFQSFDQQDDDCVDVLRDHSGYPGATMWTCTASIRGRSVDITYSELTTVSSGLAHHKRRFAAADRNALPGPDGTAERYVWRQPEPAGGVWRMAAMYADFPYAVLVEASTLRDRDRAYRSLVRSRDPRHLTVTSG